MQIFSEITRELVEMSPFCFANLLWWHEQSIVSIIKEHFWYIISHTLLRFEIQFNEESEIQESRLIAQYISCLPSRSQPHAIAATVFAVPFSILPSHTTAPQATMVHPVQFSSQKEADDHYAAAVAATPKRKQKVRSHGTKLTSTLLVDTHVGLNLLVVC